MGSSLNLNDFERIFKKHGVEIERTHGNHLKLEKILNGKKRIFIVAMESGKKIKDVYVKKARRRFDLLPKNGVSDHDFFST